MWWWNFDKKEPLQEDLMTYEKFEELREDRERMNRDKEAQKAKRKQLGAGGSSATYKIPDPT
jgi:hypothetical protein